MLNYKVTANVENGVDFPFTAPVNASGPTATDGTEFSAELLTQLWGMGQSFLAASGMSPSGNADQADASETLDAVVEQAMGRAQAVLEGGGSAADAYTVEAQATLTPIAPSTGKNGVAHSYFEGMVLSFDIAAPNTGTSTLNAFGLGVQFIKTPDGSNVVAGYLSGRLTLRYDGTNFVVMETAGNAVFGAIEADTINAPLVTGDKVQGALSPIGFLINNGFEEDIPAAGDLTIRPFSCDVGGVPVVIVADTELDQALVDISVSGWYALTVDQAGVVAVLGSPATPLTGANNTRPTGGGSTGAFGFDVYREDLQGYYYDATTRIFGAVWVDESTNAVLYSVELGSGSDEVGDNSAGSWTISDRIMTCQTTSISSGTTTVVRGNVFSSTLKPRTWPVSFSGVPSAHMVAETTSFYAWSSNEGGVTTTQITGAAMGYTVSSIANLRGYAVGTPLHLAA